MLGGGVDRIQLALSGKEGRQLQVLRTTNDDDDESQYHTYCPRLALTV